MTVYISVEGVITTKEFDDIANLEAFERELNESYGEGMWAYNRDDLVSEEG